MIRGQKSNDISNMLTINTPAKINWFLKIYGLRSDGYHEIQSLLQKITLYDSLTFSLSDDLILNSNSRILCKDNLVYKAAVFLKKAYKIKAGIKIYLDKKIPVGAGLGGGSSDAAAALIGLNEIWSLGCSNDDLSKVAEQLGSDVPFFLHGPLSRVHGRGEKISPQKTGKKLHLLLVKPSVSVSTAWAYSRFSVYLSPVKDEDLMSGDREEINQEQGKEFDLKLTKKAGKVNNIEHFCRNFENFDLDKSSDAVYNDLESVTAKEFPVIAEIKEKLRSRGAVFALMSGSGPTVYGVFESRREAEKVSNSFSGFWTAVVQTLKD